MKRIGHRASHEWCRLAWASDQAQQRWEPKVDAIQRAWHALELASTNAIVFVQPDNLAATHHEVIKQGRELIVVRARGDSVRVVLTTRELRDTWLEAWERSDNQTIGRLLGYPDCCIAAFVAAWEQEELTDTMWFMTGEYHGNNAFHQVESETVATNILLRSWGVRLVRHLPCSFGCFDSERLANQHVDWLDHNGYGAQARDLLDILSWPMEWSALHGIAEIRTPVCKISTNTDFTATEYVIRWTGSSYPAEGAYGTAFPYRQRLFHQGG